MAPTPPAPAETSTQDMNIARMLIDDIVAWRIPPGTWIREREIALRFDVSHAPVREAFRHVARIGLIRIVPWRGAHVIEINQHAANEVYELWKALFGVVCRLASIEMSEPDGRELLHRIKQYRAVVENTNDTFEHLKVSNRIGRYIAKRCGGELALELIDRLALLARWQHNVFTHQYIDRQDNAAGLRSADIFEELCLKLVERDADAAEQAARDLIGVSQTMFAGALDEYHRTHAQTKRNTDRKKRK